MIEIIPNWHPAFVHFPIAFSTAAVFLFISAQLFKVKQWAAQCLITGRWMLWAAAISACIAAVFGWIAYNSVEHDEAGHLAMTIHAYWALASLGALVVVAAFDMRTQHITAMPAYGFMAMLVVAWLLVVSAAWHGGEVVFRHGLGVMSIPAPENHGHAHGEGHDEVVPGDDGHGHDDSANGEHPHDSASVDKMPAANNAGIPPKKSGHSHAPGTPQHQD